MINSMVKEKSSYVTEEEYTKNFNAIFDSPRFYELIRQYFSEENDDQKETNHNERRPSGM